MSAVNFEMKHAQRSKIRKNHVVVWTRKFILKTFSTLQRKRKIIFLKNYPNFSHFLDHCVAKAAVFLMHGSSKVITNKCVHLFYFFLVCTYLSFWIKFYPIILESFKNSIYLTINSNFGLFCNFHYTWKHLMILDYVYYFVGSLRITDVISTYAYVS